MTKQERRAGGESLDGFFEMVEADPRTAMVRETGARPAEDYLVLYGGKDGSIMEYRDLHGKRHNHTLRGDVPSKHKVNQLIKEGVMTRRRNRYPQIKGEPASA